MKKEARVNLASVLTLSVVTILFVALVMASPQWIEDPPSNLANASQGVEDNNPSISYNLSANVTNTTAGDIFTFEFSTTVENPTSITSDTHGSGNNNSFFYWISLNATSGILTINSTLNNETGQFNITIDVKNQDNFGAGARPFYFNITPINDAPQFTNLANQSFNETELFNYIINITDEEGNAPFKLNITFLNCSVSELSTRNCSGSYGNLTLFNSSDYTFDDTAGWINFSFTPGRNDVGSYIINFTITDSGNTTTPFNATRSQIVNFTVLDINDIPYFTYWCNDENSTTEDTEHTCYINATDIDETNNLTFTTNYTWFTFNGTTNSTVITGSENFSAFINFTAEDAQVGNWPVNITITDTGEGVGGIKSNSTIFWFFIQNKNDSVSLNNISNFTTHTSEGIKTLYVNATDDDLLITQENIYNESLTFTPDNTNITVTATTEISGTNKTQATLQYNTTYMGAGNHTINLTVRDANNASIDSDLFTIEILSNEAPVWNTTMETTFVLWEGNETYLNFSQNVSDPDNDAINFTFSNDSRFDAFLASFNLSTGVLNFTISSPTDVDVGFHNVTINAYDGATFVPNYFNFTIYNVNNAPDITNDIIQVTISSTQSNHPNGGNVNFTEGNITFLRIYIDDEDFKIPQTQTQNGFYNESINLTVTITNLTTTNTLTLFNFSEYPGFPDGTNGQTLFQTNTFTPTQDDVGFYNITINATDRSNSSVFFYFGLEIVNRPDSPTISPAISNINTSILEPIYIDVNASDPEDGSDGSETSPDSNLTFTLTNLTAEGNFITINSTTGVITNTSSMTTHAGHWEYNLTVNDTSGQIDTNLFNISVFDYPSILSPIESFQFSLIENVSSYLNFSVTHTVGVILNDTLTYTLIINNMERNTTAGYGNGTDFLWAFAPNFTDETTCSGPVNLTLNVSNAKLSNSTTWTLNVSHTNYPLSFNTDIPSEPNGSVHSFQLSNYFIDIDASDSCINQPITFNYTLINSTGNAQTVTLSDWTNSTNPIATFSVSGEGIHVSEYNITAYEKNESNSSQTISTAYSNDFNVTLIVSTTTTEVPTTSSSSSSRDVPISLKILVPEPVSAKKKDKLVIPLGVWNNGEIDLNDIVLESSIAKDGLLRSDLIASFDISFIEKLDAGDRVNVTMIVDIETQATGLFEVTINGTVRDPEYSDWAKFFIEIEEEEDVIEKIIFTEEFIVGNPECAELKESLDEARDLLARGLTFDALAKTDEVLEACKRAIAQPPSSQALSRIREQLFNYISFTAIIAFTLGLIYYYYKRYKLKRAMMGYS